MNQQDWVGIKDGVDSCMCASYPFPGSVLQEVTMPQLR